jgi:SSS family solute:Na+ symporter
LDPLAAHSQAEVETLAAHGLFALDWLVLLTYALTMIGVGVYFSRRTRTAEDYLLGGRNMRSWTVGLSLFASLVSTITYLAGPGEMIRYGPLYLGGMLSFPFTFVVVGWWVIPVVMRTKATSAYEILEDRLGPGPRLLGAFFFLSLRLLWMSVIVYATVSKVLIPILGWPEARTPYLCALLGAITVLYTSIGGLRAVVITDVMQSFILFFGAFLTLGAVTVHFGGIAAWLPAGWQAHWPDPVLHYDPTARMSLIGVILANSTWYICTSVSDQIAVQRYLSTRDAKAARRTLGICLFSDATIASLLGMVGLALLAYYQANPGALPEGVGLIDQGDRLFPWFIVTVLPAGVSGLVIAGLLAAAMSSLSSGLNSSCSVITVDFLDRFGFVCSSERAKIHRAILVSFLIGIAVVVLGSLVGTLPGNLLEKAYKIVNLLVAPLAGLFFLAIFVPWARSGGAILGALASLGVVVAVNYWEVFTHEKGISFIWAMPLGLVTEVVVGMIASPFFPVRKGRGQ